ncbi:MAG: hypothetical protein WA621_08630 [Candidatus Acidiferrum sp.]|jgi:hypothetical protein
MNYRLLRGLLAFTLVFACLAQASLSRQDAPPPTQNPDVDNPPKQDNPPNPNQAPTQPPISTDGTTDSTSSAPPIRAMNGAGPLPSGRVSAVQFGPIYLQSVDFTQSIDAFDQTGQTGTLWEPYSLLRATIVLDESFKNSHLAIQYQPRLVDIDGKVSASTANLNAGWSTIFRLSPTFTATFTNTLNYYNLQGQFDNLDLMADLTTGSLVQSNFLDGSGQFLNDRTEIAFARAISARSRFAVTPYFEYFDSTGAQEVGQSEGYGLDMSYRYLIGPTKSIGLLYQVEDTHFARFIPNTVYETVSAVYSQQLSSTWRFSAGGGLTTSSFTASNSSSPPQNVQSTEWTENGEFSLIKAFTNGTLAFNYYRGEALSLQITNGFADRYDLAYQHRFSPRVEMDCGAGYYREFLSSTDTSGLYSTAGLTYWLSEKWSLQARYAFKNQKNGGANFATGQLQYVSFGIQWSPSHHTDTY